MMSAAASISMEVSIEVDEADEADVPSLDELPHDTSVMAAVAKNNKKNSS